MRKDQLLLKIGLGITLLIVGYYFLNNFTFNSSLPAQDQLIQNSAQNKSSELSIDKLTDEEVVIDYIKKNKELPHYYITKNKAREKGWQPSKGNLCEVLPGRAIGGDRFGNREKKLPLDKNYFEADINYDCKSRNADRVVFTKTGEVWITHDHYSTFIKK